jgi:hypothetical protein
MLCNPKYKQCILNVPQGSSAAAAKAVLGVHYPRTTFCRREVFAQGAAAAEGAKLCFAAAAAKAAAAGGR